MITSEEIQQHIVDIHDVIDLDEARITSDTDDDSNPIVYSIEEQLAKYIVLVEEVHDRLWALVDGIDKDKLPGMRFHPFGKLVEFEVTLDQRGDT